MATIRRTSLVCSMNSAWANRSVSYGFDICLLSTFSFMPTFLSGSMDSACLTSKDELAPPTRKGPTRPCVVSPLQGSLPHALFFDLTHDNESPMHKRSAEDALSTGALVTFCGCAIGSNNGFDDLYPCLLDLVNEKRKYQLNGSGGIRPVKRVLNHLHTEMMLGGFTEGHVHQENDVCRV
jgi:glycogen debranching enzyme